MRFKFHLFDWTFGTHNFLLCNNLLHNYLLRNSRIDLKSSWKNTEISVLPITLPNNMKMQTTFTLRRIQIPLPKKKSKIRYW